MKATRRRFLGTLLAAPAITRAQAAREEEAPPRSHGASPLETRVQWTDMLMRVAEPVLANLAANQLKQRMPVECPNGKFEERGKVTHLEALGRTLCGIAPWLTVGDVAPAEEKERARFAAMTTDALANATDPAAPDYLSFTAGGQIWSTLHSSLLASLADVRPSGKI
jgi:hypothetical protein